MSNAERFLNAYAIIEHALTCIVQDTRYVPYQQLLFKAQKHSWIVAKHLQELREYGELRNALVHLRDGKNEVIAEPTDTVTEDIEHLASLFTLDDTLLHYVTTPVKTLRMDDSILYAYSLMKKMDTSKLPVYEHGFFRGVLRVEAVCEWAVTHSDKKKVGDILEEDTGKYVRFLPETATIQDVMSAYDKALHKGIQILSILVSPHGRTDELPSGILTAKDLPHVLQAFL